MKILSSIVKALGDFIFAASLGLFIFSLALSQFISYGNIQPLVSNALKSQLESSLTPENLEIIHANLTSTCSQAGVDEAVVPLQSGDQLRVKCSNFRGATASEIPRILADSYFDQIYNMKYNCSIIDCIRNGQGQQKYLVLLSAHAFNEIKSWLNLLIVGMIIGLVLLVVSIRTWYGVLKNVGVSFFFVGLSYFVLPAFKGMLSNKIPQGTSAILNPIMENLIMILQPKLLLCLALGISLMIIGFGYGFYVKRNTKK